MAVPQPEEQIPSPINVRGEMLTLGHLEPILIVCFYASSFNTNTNLTHLLVDNLAKTFASLDHDVPQGKNFPGEAIFLEDGTMLVRIHTKGMSTAKVLVQVLNVCILLFLCPFP